MAKFTTRDIGFAIRDFLEDRVICHLNRDGEERGRDTVEFVDISDADNPVIHMLGGQTFRVRIFTQ